MQFNNKKAKDTCDGFCKCDDMISATAAAKCSAFKKDCDKLIWATWSACDNFDHDTCGDGKQFRIRKCGSMEDSTDDTVKKTKAQCYDPHVKRTFPLGKAPEMEKHPDYYEIRECHKKCPNWGPWTQCSATHGKGMQMRTDIDNPSKFDVRTCDSFGSKKAGKAAPIYTKCDARCGQGKRFKIVHDYDTKTTSRESEVCNTGVVCATEYFQCPLIPIQDLYKDMERNKVNNPAL
jgi:hypothetical protein